MYQPCVRRNRFWNNCEEHKTGLVIKGRGGEKYRKRKKKRKGEGKKLNKND